MLPTDATIKEWGEIEQYHKFPAQKAAVSWKHSGFYTKTVGTNLFVWLYKFHADHAHTNNQNYEEPEVSGDVWTMNFVIHAAPENDDEDDVKLGDSEGEEIVTANSIKITAKVYEVQKNEAD